MDGFRSYTFSLVLISLSSSVVIMLAPEKAGLMKYVRWITALCITAALLLPITSIGRLAGEKLNSTYENSKKPQYDLTETNNLIISSLENKLSESISSMVANKFEVEVSECNIELDCSDIEYIKLNAISIRVGTKSQFLLSDIEKYLSRELECKVDVKREND